MNFTPQTDRVVYQMPISRYSYKEVVSADFARDLERQLNAANAKIVELQGQLIANAHNQQDNYTYGIRR
jgi:hypothetical protein